MKPMQFIVYLTSLLMLVSIDVNAQRGANGNEQSRSGGRGQNTQRTTPSRNNNNSSQRNRNEATPVRQNAARPASSQNARPQNNAPVRNAAPNNRSQNGAGRGVARGDNYRGTSPRTNMAPRSYSQHSMAHNPRFTPRYGRARYVRNISPRALRFNVDNAIVYFLGGVYYQYVNGYGYQEIVFPNNIISTDLPYGATENYINGYLYYEYDGQWFQPVEDGYLMLSQRPSIVTATPEARPRIAFSATFSF